MPYDTHTQTPDDFSRLSGHAPEKPTGLLTDLMAHPFGLSHPRPLFSWIVRDPDNDDRQSAYRILVSTRKDRVDGDVGDLWDSGKVESGDSVAVPYGGNPLPDGQVFYWKVRTWDREGRMSPYADPVRCSTALRTWTASAIWTDKTGSDGDADPSAGEGQERQRGHFVFARKAFTLSEPSRNIDSAVIAVTTSSPGFMPRGQTVTRQYGFKLYVNGTFCGLGPHMCGYGKEDGFFHTFDVTALLTDQTNVIGILCCLIRNPCVQAELHITYTDGTGEIIPTDESWQVMDGTRCYGEGDESIGPACYYHTPVENIDARLYPQGWLTDAFDGEGFVRATVRPPLSGLRPSPVDPVRETEIRPVSVTDKGNGQYFVDFGRELIGGLRWRMNTCGADGVPVEVRCGEETDAPLSVRYAMRTGNVYRETWTLCDGPSVIETFGMMGFRYVELRGVPTVLSGEDLQNGLCAVALYQEFHEEDSFFSCDRQELCDVYDFCRYSLKVLTQDLFVDSQTRERGPYEGDAYINALSGYSFSRNYTVARFTNQFLSVHPQWCTEYAQMNAMSFYLDYLYTGHPDAIQAFYEVIRTKVHPEALCERYRLMDSRHLGHTPDGDTVRDLVDWPPTERDGYIVNDGTTGQNPYNTVINAFEYRASADLTAMAELTGHTADAGIFDTLATRLKDGINRLYDGQDGRMHQGLDENGAVLPGYPQQAGTVPLALGVLTDPETMRKVAGGIVRDGIRCSVYGSQFLFDALYRAGFDREALSLLLSRGQRSFLHQIYDLHATTTCEAWSPELKGNMTFSHAWGSSPGNVIIRDLCGITPLLPGYAKADIRPQTGGLHHVACRVPTIRGRIELTVDTDETGRLTAMTVTLPTNMTARVSVPVGHRKDDFADKDGDEPIVLLDGVPGQAVREGAFLVVDPVGSGCHRFTLHP